MSRIQVVPESKAARERREELQALNAVKTRDGTILAGLRDLNERVSRLEKLIDEISKISNP